MLGCAPAAEASRLQILEICWTLRFPPPYPEWPPCGALSAYDRQVGPSVRIGEPESRPRGGASTDPDVRRVLLHSGGILLVGGAAAAVFAAGWHSPVRVVLALAFLLFCPGLALAELLDVREPVLQLALATGASLALETLVGVALLYAGVYSAELAFAVVLALSAAILAAAVVRAVRTTRPVRDEHTVPA
jgi:hypothetical protein